MIATFALAAPILATGVDLRSFPLEPAGVDPTTALPKFVTREGEPQALLELDRLVLRDAPLPFGGVDLKLERIDLEAMDFGFYVDGVQRPGLLDELDMTLWQGEVAGDKWSEVMLSVSTRGVRGWVKTNGEFFHFMPQPGADGWDRTETWIASESDVRALGVQDLRECALDMLPNGGRPTAPVGGPEVDPGQVGGSPLVPFGGSVCDEPQASLSVETDYQLYQLYNDLNAATAYVTTLLGAVNGRYQDQIGTNLVFPYVQFHTTPADGWSTPDVAEPTQSYSVQMLSEFVGSWTGNIPFDAEVGVFLSGAPLGGGVAYVGVLCEGSNSEFTFAVCGNIDGLLPFPVQSGPTTWDFIVTAHELGHNFASPHTHDYSPQIDNCAGGGCVSDGTVMSYCHLCPGGLNNMTTFFHPTVVNVMSSHAQQCLPTSEPLFAPEQPTLIAPDVATNVEVNVVGSPIGGVNLVYRFDAGASYLTVPMTLGSGTTWSADLPGAPCGSDVEYFFSMVDAGCGPFQSPAFTPDVGIATNLFADNFQNDLGWTVGAPGDDATTGIWEKVNPNGTGAQPEDDFSPVGGQCYITGQGTPGGGLGENDVDGGVTTLISPAIDLSTDDATISYRRWYSNNAGGTPNADVFEVEVSNGGPWVNVETVGPAGAGTSGGWIFSSFVVSDFVTPTANVQVRFRASDEGDGSLVEAGVDDFFVDRIDCEVCQPDLGFGGPGNAVLAVCGEPLATGNTADLTVTSGPANSIGTIVVGVQNNPTPIFGGTLVPSGDVTVPFSTDATGAAALTVVGGTGGGSASVYIQALLVNGLLLDFSNAVELQYLP